MKFTDIHGKTITTNNPSLLVYDSVSPDVPRYHVEIYIADGTTEFHPITENEFYRLSDERRLV